MVAKCLIQKSRQRPFLCGHRIPVPYFCQWMQRHPVITKQVSWNRRSLAHLKSPNMRVGTNEQMHIWAPGRNAWVRCAMLPCLMSGPPSPHLYLSLTPHCIFHCVWICTCMRSCIFLFVFVFVFVFVFIGPESDHLLPMSVTHTTNWLLFSKLD